MLLSFSYASVFLQQKEVSFGFNFSLELCLRIQKVMDTFSFSNPVSLQGFLVLSLSWRKWLALAVFTFGLADEFLGSPRPAALEG